MRSPFFLPEARERLRSSLRLVAQEQSRKTLFCFARVGRTCESKTAVENDRAGLFFVKGR